MYQVQEAIYNGKNAMLAIAGRPPRHPWQQLQSTMSLPKRLLEGFSQGQYFDRENWLISTKTKPRIATPLIKQIQSYFTALPTGQQNPISFSPDLMRLKHVETISTFDHLDPIVAAGKKLGVISAATVLLEASINRKKGTAADAQTPCPKRKSWTKTSGK